MPLYNLLHRQFSQCTFMSLEKKLCNYQNLGMPVKLTQKEF